MKRANKPDFLDLLKGREVVFLLFFKGELSRHQYDLIYLRKKRSTTAFIGCNGIHIGTLTIKTDYISLHTWFSLDGLLSLLLEAAKIDFMNTIENNVKPENKVL